MAVAFVKNHTVASNKTAGTTLAVTLSSDVPAGNLIVLRAVFDNAATASKPLLSSITRAAGETNTWATALGANSTSTSAGAFASGAMTWIRTSVTWPAGSYTVTLDTSTVQKAAAFQEFSGALATIRGAAGTGYSTTTAAAIATTQGADPLTGDLVLGFIFGSNVAAAQTGDNHTEGGSWSSVFGIGSTGSSGATNNFGVGQYKILTSPTPQVVTNAVAMTAGNGAFAVALQQYVPPSITQAAYRFYADGTETGSTALAAQDTAPTVDVTAGDVPIQLRTRLQSTSAVAIDPTDDFQLQYEKNASGAWVNVTQKEAFSSPSLSAYRAMGSGGPTKIGQSFLGNGEKLTEAIFYMVKTGNPTGPVMVEVFAHTGTFGSGGVATGSTLITSASVDATAIVSVAYNRFTFDDPTILTNGTPYVIALSFSTGTASDYVSVADTTTSSSHAGNQSTYTAGAWTGTTNDTTCRGYTVPSGTAVTPYNTLNLTDGAATTNRLGAGTGSFVAGKVSEDGLVDNLGWTGNNYTELLYSIQLKQADLAPADTLRFRVLRNGETTGLTYTQTPTVTIGGGGPPESTGTLAVTDGRDTLAAAGQPTAPTFTSTLVATDGVDTFVGVGNAAAATVTSTATLVAADGLDTFAATAVVTSTATLAQTDGRDTLAATPTFGPTATFTSTDGRDTIVAAAQTTAPTFSATLAQTDGHDTFAATPTFGPTSTLVVTDGTDTIVAVGNVGAPTFTSLLASTDGLDTIVASAQATVPTFAGTLATTDGRDLFAATATFASVSSLAQADGRDTMVATGQTTAPTFTSALVQTDGRDTIVATATFGPTATFAVTDGHDTMVASGQTTAPTFTSTLAQTDGVDTIVAAVSALPPTNPSTLAVTDGVDTILAFASATEVGSSSLVAVDGRDTMVAAGQTTAPTFSATLAQTDGRDILVAPGQSTAPTFTGTLIRTDGRDGWAASASTTAPTFTATLIQTDGRDTFVAIVQSSPPGTTATLAVADGRDTFSAMGSMVGVGVIVLNDAAAIFLGSRVVDAVYCGAEAVWPP